MYTSFRHGSDPRSFGRPFAMRKWISAWLTANHIPYVVGVCLSDPALPGYFPFLAKHTGRTVWMPAGTWRATPWLLHLAHQVAVKMLWLVDDNVKGMKVSYVDREMASEKLTALPKVQFMEFLRRAAKDCASACAVACTVATTANPLHKRPRAEPRAETAYSMRPRTRGLSESLTFSLDSGVLYGAWTGFAVGPFLSWNDCGAQPRGVLLPSASQGSNTICDSEITMRMYMSGAHWLKYTGIITPKAKSKGGQNKYSASKRREIVKKNSLRILTWAWKQRRHNAARWTTAMNWWSRNAFVDYAWNDIPRLFGHAGK